MDRRNKCRSLTQFLDLLVNGDAVGVVPQQHHRREAKLLELAKCIRFFEQFKHGFPIFPMVAPGPSRRSARLRPGPLTERERLSGTTSLFLCPSNIRQTKTREKYILQQNFTKKV